MRDDQLLDCFQKLEDSMALQMSQLETNVTQKIEKLAKRVSTLENIMLNNDEFKCRKTSQKSFDT